MKTVGNNDPAKPSVLFKRYRFYLKKIIRLGKRLGHAKKSEETIHDIRIATRRLEALLGSAFGFRTPKHFLRILKKGRRLRKRLTPVREMDVFMDLWEKLTTPGPLAKTVARELKKTRKKKFGGIEGKPGLRIFQRALKESKRMSSRKIMMHPDRVRRELMRVVKKVEAHDKKYEANRQIGELHRLRIAFKHLRYGLEGLAELDGNKWKPFLAPLKVVQDHLGNIHDLDTFRHFLEERLLDREPPWIKSVKTGIIKVANRSRRKLAISLNGWDMKKSGYRETLDHIRSGLKEG